MKNSILSALLLLSFNIFADLGVSDDFLERFSSLPSYTNVKISPDGRMISVLTKMPDNKKGISIFDAEDLSLINAITLTKEEEVASYYWVNNERLLIQIGYYDSWGRGSIGEYFAINYDGFFQFYPRHKYDKKVLLYRNQIKLLHAFIEE